MFRPRRLDSGLINFLVTLRFSFMGMYKSYCECWKIKMCQYFSKKYFNKKIISIKSTLYSICSNLEIWAINQTLNQIFFQVTVHKFYFPQIYKKKLLSNFGCHCSQKYSEQKESYRIRIWSILFLYLWKWILSVLVKIFVPLTIWVTWFLIIYWK